VNAHDFLDLRSTKHNLACLEILSSTQYRSEHGDYASTQYRSEHGDYGYLICKVKKCVDRWNVRDSDLSFDTILHCPQNERFVEIVVSKVH